MISQVNALSGIGIGIRKDGPFQAAVGDTIQYAITVYNLGDFWIRNITIADVFPNGTVTTWVSPDLLPVGQVGDSFNISQIPYTIRDQDVILQNSPHVLNHAEVTGYADTGGLGLVVHAETNFATFVMRPIVGGYAVSIKTLGLSTPTIVYIVLVLSVTTLFAALRRNTANTVSVFGRLKEQRKSKRTDSRGETR